MSWIDTAAGVAEAHGYVPRTTRVMWNIPLFVLALVGDSLVLAFYAIAYGSRLPVLKHPLHKAIIMMFAANLVGSVFYFWVPFAPPGTPECQATVTGTVAFLAGEYSSSASICWLLFYSLVLHGQRSKWVDAMTLAFPVGSVVMFGLTTINGASTLDRDGACWFSSMFDWRAIFTYVSLLLFGLTTSVMVGCIIWSLRVNRASLQIANNKLRVPAGGMLSSEGRSLQEDSQVLSKRLVWYPLTIIVFAGMGIFISIVGGRVGQVIGEQMLMACGFINASAFFLFDPTAGKIAADLVLFVDATERSVRSANEIGRTPPPAYMTDVRESERSKWHVKVPWAFYVARGVRGVLRLVATKR